MMSASRVLIVEDERIVQLHLRNIVSALGHEVVGTAVSQSEALRSANATPPELVLMDIHLAEGSDGVDTARLLRDRFDCSVIFVTAYADEATVERSASVAAAGYLVKPFSDSEVRAAITTALNSRRRTTPPRRELRPLPFGSETRLMVYSHDTFGLGHLRRSLNLIRGLALRFPDLSALLVTGSPMVHRYTMPRGSDYLKLPAVRKVSSDQYEARSLSMSDAGIADLRSNLLLRTVRDYEPNAVLVDHSPLGMKDELRPSLEWLREKGGCTRILGLRDIIDDPDAVKELWQRRGIYDAIEELYDQIAIYGSRDVFDPVTQYGFPRALAERTRFVNYVCDESAPTDGDSSTSDRKVAVTVGGGDGAEGLIETFLRMMRQHGDAVDFRAEIVTGPFVDSQLRSRLEELVDGLPVKVTDFVPSIAPIYRRADLVVATGGYNTATDLLSHAKRTVVVPRVLHRQEQAIRARRFAELGVWTMLHPDELTTESLFDAIRAGLDGAETLTEARERGLISLDGCKNFADLCGALQVHAPVD